MFFKGRLYKEWQESGALTANTAKHDIYIN